MTARIPSFENPLAADGAPILGAPEVSAKTVAPITTQAPVLDARLLRFVQHALRDLLGRPASEKETLGWVRQLECGVSRNTLATCLLNSSERRDRWVQRIYARFLKRTPNHDMLRFWSEQLAARRSQEEVLANILSSPDYLEANGERNEQFVRALYRDTSSHRPTQEEVDAWVGLIDSGCASRTAVAFQFLSSDEFRRRTIRDWYLEFLEREPDQDGVAYCLEQLKAGLTAERAQSELLASREYFNRAVRFARAS